jgi:copper chaperone CopZ
VKEDAVKHFALSTPTVSCSHCRIAIQKALAPLTTNVRVDLVKQEVHLDADPAKLLPILDALEDEGYPATVLQEA